MQVGNLRWAVALACAGLAVCPSAEAIEAIETEVESHVVASIVDTDGAADSPALLYDLSVAGGLSHLFDNGLEVGGKVGARVQGDPASRPAFSGNIAGPGWSGGNLRAPSTGLARSSAPVDVGPRGAVEAAYVYVKGAWGEISAGQDLGAAVRLDARPPQVLDMATATSARLDPTGAAFVRARNDPTGYNAKLSYLSQRLVGFRVGLSYTPSVDSRGLDFNGRLNSPGTVNIDLDNVLEGGLSFAHRFGADGYRLRFGLTGVRAAASASAGDVGDYEALGAGMELDKNGWMAGLRWLSSNNANRGDAGYDAAEFGLLKDAKKWRAGLEIGFAEDELLNVEGLSWSVGCKWKLNQYLDAGVAYQHSDLEAGAAPDAGRIRVGKGEGLLFELTVRKR